VRGGHFRRAWSRSFQGASKGAWILSAARDGGTGMSGSEAGINETFAFYSQVDGRAACSMQLVAACTEHWPKPRRVNLEVGCSCSGDAEAGRISLGAFSSSIRSYSVYKPAGAVLESANPWSWVSLSRHVTERSSSVAAVE
jgi:hypothetical protein